MKKAIFTMGLPGAGKSRILKTEYTDFLQTATLIDPDEIKKEKVDYDPKRPEVYHVWSKTESQRRMYNSMKSNVNVVVDGTGTNVEKMIQWIRDFKNNDYQVELVYVKVPLEIAIYRNAHRERVVPEYLIVEKAETIELAYELLVNEVDTHTVFEQF
jgi:predicted ABC-type ATPase